MTKHQPPAQIRPRSSTFVHARAQPSRIAHNRPKSNKIEHPNLKNLKKLKPSNHTILSNTLKIVPAIRFFQPGKKVGQPPAGPKHSKPPTRSSCSKTVASLRQPSLALPRSPVFAISRRRQAPCNVRLIPSPTVGMLPSKPIRRFRGKLPVIVPVTVSPCRFVSLNQDGRAYSAHVRECRKSERHEGKQRCQLLKTFPSCLVG